MTKTTLLLLPVLGAAVLSSCAYMQTHKNIEEIGRSYKGIELKADNMSLHHKSGQWYISAPEGSYKKSYPLIHDEIFIKDDNAPTYTLLGTTGGRVYYPISAGTATCLQLSDGYAQTNALVTETLSSGKEPITDLKGASTRTIRAEIADSKHPAMLIGSPTPEHVGIAQQIGSTVDMCTLDLAGTVLYNVAIPVMAPFRFFWEFCNED